MTNGKSVWTFQGGQYVIKTITATAGNVATRLAPGVGVRWIVLYGSITLVADGTAANREIRRHITDTVNILTTFFKTTAITAGQTRTARYGHSNDHTNGAVDGNFYFVGTNGQPIIVDGGNDIYIDINNGVAGDSYSGYVVVMEIKM